MALLVPDRGRTVVDGPLGPVLGNQERVVRQPDDVALLRHTQGRVLDRLVGVLVDDAEHFLQRSAPGVGVGPPGQVLGDPVYERHPASRVGGDHGIPDAHEGGVEQLPLFVDQGR